MYQVDLFDKTAKASAWISSNFWIPELHGPMWLAPYQIETMDVALEKDANDDFKHALIVWSDVKKSMKSSIAAAVALRRAFQLDWGSIKVVANDLKQAKSRSYFYLERSLILNPQTKEMVDRGEIKITKYKIDLLFNNTTIEAIPADPKGEAGGNDDMVLFTELWTYQHEAHKRLWTELVTPANKFGRSFRWAESYAGFTGQSAILENLYQANVKDEYRLEDTIAPLYKNGGTFTMWNHTPRMPWHSKAYFSQQMSELSEDEFRRVHKNEWVGSTTKFVQDLWWDSCRVDSTKIEDQETVVVAVDAAYAENGDCFSVVVVGKHPTDQDKYAVKEARFWRAGNNGKLEFKNVNDESDPKYPYGYVIDLAKRYRVLEVAYDPYQLHSMATEQNKKRYAFWREFTQGKPRSVSDNELYDSIRDGTLVHPGIAQLSEHVKNAGRDSKGRLVKLDKKRKIDGAVATSMANNRARYYRL